MNLKFEYRVQSNVRESTHFDYEDDVSEYLKIPELAKVLKLVALDSDRSNIVVAESVLLRQGELFEPAPRFLFHVWDAGNSSYNRFFDDSQFDQALADYNKLKDRGCAARLYFELQKDYENENMLFEDCILAVDNEDFDPA